MIICHFSNVTFSRPRMNSNSNYGDFNLDLAGNIFVNSINSRSELEMCMILVSRIIITEIIRSQG
jgi:hypothetical protein